MQTRILAGILCALAAAAASAQVGTNMGVHDANSASEAELLTAPHLDAALAAKIVAARPIGSATELDALLPATLDEPERDELYGRLFVTINLNNAPRNELLLIPGLSDRMAHAFEEYRPYTSLEKFRREIGKYVDQKEVTRLQRYVVIE